MSMQMQRDLEAKYNQFWPSTITAVQPNKSPQYNGATCPGRKNCLHELTNFVATKSAGMPFIRFKSNNLTIEYILPSVSTAIVNGGRLITLAFATAHIILHRHTYIQSLQIHLGKCLHEQDNNEANTK